MASAYHAGKPGGKRVIDPARTMKRWAEVPSALNELLGISVRAIDVQAECDASLPESPERGC